MRISLPAAGRMNGESTAALKQAETENGLQITGNDVILKDMASFLTEYCEKGKNKVKLSLV